MAHIQIKNYIQKIQNLREAKSNCLYTAIRKVTVIHAILTQVNNKLCPQS